MRPQAVLNGQHARVEQEGLRAVMPADVDWDRGALLPGLQPVIDPRDHSGVKNELIHATHVRGLRLALRTGTGRYSTALDFGCGIGRLTPTLLEFADQVVGADPSPRMLERARRDHGGPRTRFVLPQALPALTGPVLVLSVYVLQHLECEEVVSTLRDLRKRSDSSSRCVLINRVVRAPGCDPGDIEPRNVSWYQTVLLDAGWTPRGTRTIRRAWSLPMRANALVSPRLPPVARRRSASVCAAAEFARARQALTGEYVDACVWADA
jgi:SAM-dependent methyltransferase